MEKKVIEFMGGILEYCPSGKTEIQGKEIAWENNVKLTVGKQKTVKLTKAAIQAIVESADSEDVSRFIETLV